MHWHLMLCLGFVSFFKDLGTVDDIQSEPTSSPPPRPVRDRMVSVDAFRGYVLFLHSSVSEIFEDQSVDWQFVLSMVL